MQLAQASAFVTNFKGAALSCLFLMWAMREDQRNWTRNDLSYLTGWSREQVATGLRRLQLHNLAFRLDYETWQLTDEGYQLSFDGLDGNANYMRVEKNDSQHGSSLKNHDMHVNHDLFKPLPLPRVEKNDSHVVRDSIFDELVEQLIRCGSPPDTAHKAIDQAFVFRNSDQEIRRRILWWRCYCLTHNGMKFPGKLIAARVAAGIDTPDDFETRDMPDRFYELRQELEDFEREYQEANP